jgi:hypothetical protein
MNDGSGKGRWPGGNDGPESAGAQDDSAQNAADAWLDDPGADTAQPDGANESDHGDPIADGPQQSGRGFGDFELGDELGEFAAELKLLAEAVLERVEPVLRRTAVEGETEWSNCSWCPMCVAAALMRGEHHDVLATVADHGTAIITVLREALAGVPVEPVLPPDDDARTGTSDDNSVSHHHTPRDDSMPHADSAPESARDARTSPRPNSVDRTRSQYVGIPVTIKA